MHLIYLDESGSTGTNLGDTQQPIFLLGALIVPETVWQALERDLDAAAKRHLPAAAAELEVHAVDLRSGRGAFRGIPIETRIALRDDWLRIAGQHGLKVVYRAIEKKRYHIWLNRTFGAGIVINPYVAAFPMVARVVDDYLARLPGTPLGMFIFDENKEIVRDLEKSIRVFRGGTGALRLSQVIEKGFFIDSSKSRPLQLCDLCTLVARKKVEREAGSPRKSIDESGTTLLESLIIRGDESFEDVLAWLVEQRPTKAQKKERPGTMSGAD